MCLGGLTLATFVKRGAKDLALAWLLKVCCFRNFYLGISQQPHHLGQHGGSAGRVGGGGQRRRVEREQQ